MLAGRDLGTGLLLHSKTQEAALLADRTFSPDKEWHLGEARRVSAAPVGGGRRQKLVTSSDAKYDGSH